MAKRGAKRTARPVDLLHPGAMLLLLLVILAAFHPVLSADWVNWDDQQNFLENPAYRGLSSEHLGWMWTTFHMGHYQPLSWMSLGLDHLLWGMDARGYHATNLALHALAALLFYQFLRVLFRRVWTALPEHGNTLGALAGALLFAVHPLRVESVAWVTERRDMLSLALWLPALLAWLGAVDPERGAVGRRLLYWVAVGCHALSLLAKAHAITFPVVLLLMDVYPLGRLKAGEPGLFRRSRALLWEKMPFFLLAAGAALLALLAQRDAGALQTLETHGIPARLAVAAQSTLFYLTKTLVPTGLSPLYLLEQTVEPSRPRYLISAVLLAALGLGLFLFRRRFPAGLATFAAYLILLSPVCGLSQAGPQAMADRYTYFSLLPLAALAGAGLALLLARVARPLFAFPLLALLLIVGLLGSGTVHQSRYWRNGETLWRRAIEVNPESFMATYNLGEALAQEHRFTEAIPWYRRSLELKPAQGRVLAGLVLAHLLLDQRPESMAALAEISKEKDPGWYAQARYLCGRALAARGRRAEAVPLLEQALAVVPGHADALFILVGILDRLDRKEEAARWWNRYR